MTPTGYGRVIWRDLYPGIDLVVRGGAGGSGLEYDLLVAAGASLEQVRIRFEGIDELRAGAGESLEGSLAGELFLQLPATCWQVLPEGGIELVTCTWREREQGLFQPEVAGWDPGLSLVIDPELVWCTYLGASNQDESTSMDGNARGEIVVSGVTNSASFVQTPGTFQSPIGPLNVFATKFRQADGRLIYSSVFGGGPVNSGQVSTDVALDDKGRATVVGRTTAANFPTTPGSFQPVKQSAINKESGFVIQFTPKGDDLVFGTYLEGPLQGSSVDAVAVDQRGVVVGGAALGPDFPVTPGAYQTDYKSSAIGITEGFAARLDPSGSYLVWATYLGGSGGEGATSIALGLQGEVYLAGPTASHDFPTTVGAYQQSIPSGAWITAFVSKLSPGGDALVWSSYLCGSTKNGEEDTPIGIALDASGTVFVSGGTTSPGFPTTPGAYKTVFPPGAFGQGFVTRFQADGKALLWSTLIGDNQGGGSGHIAVDPSGVATLAGGLGQQVALTPGAFDLTQNGNLDGAIFRLAPGGDRLFYGSYLGGPVWEALNGVHLSYTGRVSITGIVNPPGGWPTTPDAFQPTFQGGQFDATVTTLDLLLQGLELTGASLPSCLGTLQINATEMPLAGSASFALWCSGAPPSTSGWLLLGTALAAPIQTGGLPLWISPSGPLARIPVSTDMFGYAEVALPLSAASAGDELAAQFLFQSPPTCPGPSAWSSSPALVITVQ